VGGKCPARRFPSNEKEEKTMDEDVWDPFEDEEMDEERLDYLN